MSEEMPDRTSEDMPERMSEDMSEDKVSIERSLLNPRRRLEAPRRLKTDAAAAVLAWQREQPPGAWRLVVIGLATMVTAGF